MRVFSPTRGERIATRVEIVRFVWHRGEGRGWRIVGAGGLRLPDRVFFLELRLELASVLAGGFEADTTGRKYGTAVGFFVAEGFLFWSSGRRGMRETTEWQAD